MSDTVSRIHHLASLIDVPTDVVPRIANSHPAGKLSPQQEQTIRAATGWSSGAMVARYTRALSGELAVEEFQRSWGGQKSLGLSAVTEQT